MGGVGVVRSVGTLFKGWTHRAEHPACAVWAERGGKRTREGAKSGMGRLERMKHGSGIKDRDDKSSGIEILMSDAFAKINPTDPLRLAKQAARRKRN